jgi:hypothetical protein
VLEEVTIVQPEIFITDRTPRISRKVFKEKNLIEGFFLKTLAFHRTALSRIGTPL